MADIELVINIPEEDYINIKNAINSLIENGVERASMSKVCLAILDGTPLPKGHGRLIDAAICLNKAWQNFYKQEDEHEKNIDDYDIMRDRVFEQSGFECCQQAIVNALTIIEADKE